LTIYNGGTASRTALMTVGATGNVLIGTTSAATSSTLNVVGTGYQPIYVNTTAAGGGGASFQRSGTPAMYVGTGGSSWLTGSSTADGLMRSEANMLFAVGNTERMRIDSSGNIGASNAIMTIGDNSRTASSSTTTGAIVCGGGLGVWSNINAGGSGNFGNTISAFSQSPSSSQQGVLLRNTFNVGGSIFSTGPATTNDFILWVGGSGTQGGITGNGAGVNYSSASDYRLKENVAPMTGALGVVAQLKPCTYIWKFDGSAGQGFIAHELQEIFPDAVTGKKDDVDEDGNIKPQGVDTSFLVATLAAAIQEQQAMIEELKTKVAALEAR
jgi:hypothetical protein